MRRKCGKPPKVLDFPGLLSPHLVRSHDAICAPLSGRRKELAASFNGIARWTIIAAAARYRAAAPPLFKSGPRRPVTVAILASP
jgi:hypothetical protein